MFRYFVILVVIAVAAWIDYKTGKIPNWLCITGVVLAIIFRHTPLAIFWMAISIVFLFFFGMLHLIGMGDIKLWMVLSCFLGFWPSCLVMLISEIIFIFRRIMGDAKHSSFVIKTLFTQLRLRSFTVMDDRSYAFAPYLFIGTLLYLGGMLLVKAH